MNIHLDTSSIDDYRLFIRAKAIPQSRCVGHVLYVPDWKDGCQGHES